MHPGPPLRLVGARACALGLVATVGGVWGHVHAGGGVPDLLQLVRVWLAASALSAGFLLREVGWLRIASLLLGEQLLIHTTLMACGGMPASMPGMADMPGMPGMSSTHMSLVPSVGMLVGHAVAAAVAGLWLWRGERTAWMLIALAGASLRILWRHCLIVPVPRASVPTVDADLLPLWGLCRARDVSRRGPPEPALL
ncbi:MAG: hypothetical protein ACTHJM_00915 [Marmoricola sp.]